MQDCEEEEGQRSCNPGNVKNDRSSVSSIFMGKSDVQSAFRLIPLSMACWAWLIMAAVNPKTNKWMYFVDKCLPFGASISCAIFQRFSDAIKHIVQYRTNRRSLSNYLDNFLFIAYTRNLCNQMIQKFLIVCEEIGVPITMDKTEWASVRIVFLGILLDGEKMILAIPEQKRIRAIKLLKKFMDKKKSTVKELQSLCGYLNFLNQAIHPGRVFMRQMYAKYTPLWADKFNRTDNGKKVLKPFHHVKLDKEFKADCQVWLNFLTHEHLSKVVNRLMIDLNMFETSEQLSFFSDASAAKELGYGCVYQTNWIFGRWESHLIDDFKPSIEVLELFALCAGIFTWQEKLANRRIIIFCDNMGVVNMVNNNASKCKHCMYLLRLLTLNNLLHNRRISVKYIKSRDNILSDALSRILLEKFKKHGKHMNSNPDTIHQDMWPLSKLLKAADN